MPGELGQNAVGFFGAAAKRNHHDDVLEAEVIPRAAHSPAFERESLAVAFAVVAASAAPAQHGIRFLGFERLATDQPRIFVALEIAHAHNDRIRVVRRRDAGDAAGERIDEVFGLVRVGARELDDLRTCSLVLEIVEVHECHRMDLDQIADDELHAGEPHAVGGQAPPAKGRCRVGQVDHHFGARLGDLVDVDVAHFEIGSTRIDMTVVALGARNGDLHPVL